MIMSSVGAVAIGRNEGERLVRCLASLHGQAARIVYVDSGSHDESIVAARAAGAAIVELDRDRPFTAARARNEGLACLLEGGRLDYVQFVDGDCELQSGWIAAAAAFLDKHPDVAVVCGRRRERFPEATVWNRLIDMEWDTPVGQTKACGGDSMMRVSALESVGGFNPRLIAGEEPELCVRMRKAGWQIFRLNVEMTLHDAAMSKFTQWWRRTMRGGYAFAEGVALHGGVPERHYVKETTRALIWGIGVPVASILGIAAGIPWMAALILLWPAQIARLIFMGSPALYAIFIVIGKLPEAVGVIYYILRSARNTRAKIIEYK